MKKGFTLIELLAVIVILAIIALIATPIILNIIGNAKDESNEMSKELYLRAVNQAIATRNLTEEFNPSECTVKEDGNLLCGEKDLLVEVNGIKPCSGTITFNKKGKIIDETLNYCDSDENQDEELGETKTLIDGSTFNEKIKSLDIKPSKIEFLSNGKLPSGMSLEQLTVLPTLNGLSIDQDDSIIGYMEDIVVDEKTKRNLYIYSEYLISFNEDSSNMFYELTTDEIIFNKVDTSKVTNMKYMFGYTDNLINLDLSSFDTSNVTNMSGMFYHLWLFMSLSKLENITFGKKFNTSNVTDMSYMFNGCDKLLTLDVSNFDTSKVIYMSNMFMGCSKLTELDVSGFDTSSVTDMSWMFDDCSGLTTLNISNFDTKKVTNMEFMLAGLNLTELNLKNLDTSSVENMSYMFDQDKNIINLDLSNFDTSQVTDMTAMFRGCTSLKTVDLHSFNTSKVTKKDKVFESATSLETILVSNNWTLKTDLLTDTIAKSYTKV